MKRYSLAVALAVIVSLPVRATFWSPDSPVALGGTTFLPWQVIDNSSGNTIEDRVARCDSINGKPKKIQARTEFTWGGR